MKSVFVYSRVLPDGQVVVAIGEKRTPEASRVLGTFATLERARSFRDKMRLEATFGLLDDVHPYPKAKRASAGR